MILMQNRVTGALMIELTLKEQKLETLTSQNILHQLIKKQTHILDTSSS